MRSAIPLKTAFPSRDHNKESFRLDISCTEAKIKDHLSNIMYIYRKKYNNKN